MSGSARVLVTRPADQADEVCALLSAAGFEPVCVPTISVEPVPDLGPLDAALRSLAAYDLAVFASPNAVRIVVQRATALGIAPAAWAGVDIVAGPSTAQELAACGLRAARIISPFSAEAALAALAQTALAGRRVLLPRAEQGRDELPDGLAARGAIVDAIAVYRTVPVDTSPDLIEALRHRLPQAVTFFSPSAVTGFVNALHAGRLHPTDLPASLAIACIGSTTAEAVRRAGLPEPVVATDTTARAVVDLLAARVSAASLVGAP